MAINWVIYGKFKLDQMINTNICNLAAGGNTVKVMLANSNYSPAANTDQYLTTPQASEVANGSSYTAGGVTISATQTCTLASNVVTYTNSNANVITWAQDANTGFSNAIIAVLYMSTGTAANSPLIAYANLGSNQTITTGSLTLQLDANGIFTLT